MSIYIYNRLAEPLCTKYIAVRSAKIGQIEFKGPVFPFLTNLKNSILLKIAFSGHKPQYSSTKLKFLFPNLSTSNFQDFCTPIKHTSLQKIINLATHVLSGIH